MSEQLAHLPEFLGEHLRLTLTALVIVLSALLERSSPIRLRHWIGEAGGSLQQLGTSPGQPVKASRQIGAVDHAAGAVVTLLHPLLTELIAEMLRIGCVTRIGKGVNRRGGLTAAVVYAQNIRHQRVKGYSAYLIGLRARQLQQLINHFYDRGQQFLGVKFSRPRR